MADRVESVAARLLDDLPGGGSVDTVDLVERYAAQLPVALDPDLSWRRYRQADRALRAMHRWFHDHVVRLRRDPGEDLLSQVILAESDDPLTDTELHQVGLLVLGASFETTVNLIGNAVRQVDAHPDQLRWLQANPDGWGNAIEEVLRFDSPVQLTLRAAHRDVEVAGAPVAAGDGVLTMLGGGGANRDPAVFTDPHAFDVTRPKFPDLAVAGPPQRRDTRVLRGYAHLPVRTGSAVAA